MSALHNFPLPLEALNDLNGFKPQAIGDGVARYSGHDGYGLGFRFFIFDRYNKMRSKAAGCELFDPIEMKETFVDRKTRLHEIVTDRIRHQHPEEYKRFKEGKEAPGTALEKWGVMPSHEILTLIKDGIFTVEQFSIQDADKVQHRYPKSFFEYFTRAQQYVASKTGLVEVEKNAAAMVELQKAYAQLEAKLLVLENSQAVKKANKKSPGRPRKAIVLPENIGEDTEQ